MEDIYSSTLAEALEALDIISREVHFVIGTLYEDRSRPNVCMMPTERDGMHLVVSHRNKIYRATSDVVDGVETIKLPCGTFDARGIA